MSPVSSTLERVLSSPVLRRFFSHLLLLHHGQKKEGTFSRGEEKGNLFHEGRGRTGRQIRGISCKFSWKGGVALFPKGGRNKFSKLGEVGNYHRST